MPVNILFARFKIFSAGIPLNPLDFIIVIFVMREIYIKMDSPLNFHFLSSELNILQTFLNILYNTSKFFSISFEKQNSKQVVDINKTTNFNFNIMFQQHYEHRCIFCNKSLPFINVSIQLINRFLVNLYKLTKYHILCNINRTTTSRNVCFLLPVDHRQFFVSTTTTLFLCWCFVNYSAEKEHPMVLLDVH